MKEVKIIPCLDVKVLAASIFHFGEISIPEAKAFLKSKGISVRS
jgi:imidazole glycerol phosphate synthase subunit HisF